MEKEPNKNQYTGKNYRDEVISKLSLSKQFSMRQHLKNCDALTKDQAIELLKDTIVQLAHKDMTFELIMKDNWMDFNEPE